MVLRSGTTCAWESPFRTVKPLNALKILTKIEVTPLAPTKTLFKMS